MYKIFVNDKPIVLTSEVSSDKHYKTYPLKYVDLPRVIRDFRKTDTKGVYLYHKNSDKLLRKFLKKFLTLLRVGVKSIIMMRKYYLSVEMTNGIYQKGRLKFMSQLKKVQFEKLKRRQGYLVL